MTDSSNSLKDRFFEHPILNLAFRSSFLLAAIGTVVAIVAWLGFLNGWTIPSNTAISPMVWHLHEMFYGFGVLVATGFVLTAVQTWTGVPSIKGAPLAVLVGLWLVARTCFILNNNDVIYLGLVAQMLWWLGVIVTYTRIMILSKNVRNYIFIPIFSALMLSNLAIVLLDLNGESFWAQHLGRMTVFLFVLLMGVIGGRVIPFFTKVRTKADPKPVPNWLEHLQLAGGVAVVLTYLGASWVGPTAPGVLMMMLGVVHLYRIIHWNPLKSIVEPLLWTLQLSYAFRAIGLILMGVSLVMPQLMFSAVLHVVTIGAMGLMILSMMSRVSLGHTGRMVKSPRLITAALGMIIVAMIARVLLAWLGLPREAWLISGGLWIAAFVLFIVTYWPILTAPRVENRL